MTETVATVGARDYAEPSERGEATLGPSARVALLRHAMTALASVLGASVIPVTSWIIKNNELELERTKAAQELQLEAAKAQSEQNAKATELDHKIKMDFLAKVVSFETEQPGNARYRRDVLSYFKGVLNDAELKSWAAGELDTIASEDTNQEAVQRSQAEVQQAKNELAAVQEATAKDEKKLREERRRLALELKKKQAELADKQQSLQAVQRYLGTGGLERVETFCRPYKPDSGKSYLFQCRPKTANAAPIRVPEAFLERAEPVGDWNCELFRPCSR